MQRRSLVGNKQRPLSAIFIGSLDATASPPDLPGLPEPPSPSASSNRSGLPSPPATNSTGSGSVGEDPDTSGLLRKKSTLFKSKSDMLNGTYEPNFTKRASVDEDEDDPNENENDEDHTARLSLDSQRSFKVPASSEGMSALQRVRSLAQRNRIVLDKLSSISRLGSPVPPKSRSPFTPPPNTSSTSATSSENPRAPSRTSQLSSKIQSSSDTLHSGSETEREPRSHGHGYSSSDSLSTPTSSFSEIKPSNYVRTRQISAPDSPAKAMQSVRNTRQKDRDRSRGSSPGPSRTPRKRVSMVVTPAEYRYRDDEGDDQGDVAAAALAAIASSRRSPAETNGSKKRPTLPREFREKDRRSMDGRPDPPSTPSRNRVRDRRSPSPPRSPRTSVSFLPNPTSPRKPGAARYSTVRDLTRKHQTRWLSEDLSANLDGDDDAPDRSPGAVGRRQGHRAGSSDSPLAMPGGRTLLSEGLRAAGLTKRREPADDVFVNSGGPTVPRRTRSNGAASIISGGEIESPTQGAAPSRVSDGISPSTRAVDPRTLAFAQKLDRGPAYPVTMRPATSMAALHSDTPPLRSGTTARSRRPNYEAGPPHIDEDPPRGQDRTYSSPFAPPRSTPNYIPPSNALSSTHDAHAEHRRLMLESLSMFESQLSRLPPMGQTSTTTIPEVFQASQHLVHMMDKLNAMLKTSTNRALEAQIDHEVSDYAGMTVAEVISTIGMEHRDNLRLSDEVVRTMTAFLLNVGKLLRDVTSTKDQQQHLRAVSLDDEASRRPAQELSTLSTDRRSSDGRRSGEARRSWDPRETSQATQYMGNLERISQSRPSSSLNMLRTPSGSEGHSVVGVVESTPETVRNAPPATTSSAHRSFTARENRPSSQSMKFTQAQIASFENSPSHEPSPTPASRARPEHSRALPPLAIAPSLPNIPSESLLNRSTASTSSVSTDKSSNRRKVSGNSTLTIRPEPSSTPLLPFTKVGSATTAVTTTTVSNSPEDGPIGMQRSESNSSVRTNSVTFSRPSTASVSSTLSGLQQRRNGLEHPSLSRIRTASDGLDGEGTNAPGGILSPMSGDETERPKTLAARSRVSLDGRGLTPESVGRGSQASTLVQSRKERRRTITEIFR